MSFNSDLSLTQVLPFHLRSSFFLRTKMESEREHEQRPPLQPRESSVASFQTARDGTEAKPEDALERLNLGKPITETETTRISTEVPRQITLDVPSTTTSAAVGRTRSGSATATGGTRFASGGNVQHSATMTAGLERNPSAGPSQPQGVGRRSSIVEASGASLKTWWNNFTGAPAVGEEPSTSTDAQPLSTSMSTTASGTALKREPSRQEKGNVVFGEKLEMSLIYAAVPISTARHEPASGSSTEGSGSGGMYVWGYVPVVVAKW
jgi:hypothetical protein